MIRTLIFVVILMLSCSDSDFTYTPSEECENLITYYYCPKVYSCIGVEVQDCESAVRVNWDCSKVVRVERTRLEVCHMDLSSITCTVFYSNGMINVPASCNELFGI